MSGFLLAEFAVVLRIRLHYGIHSECEFCFGCLPAVHFVGLTLQIYLSLKLRLELRAVCCAEFDVYRLGGLIASGLRLEPALSRVLGFTPQGALEIAHGRRELKRPVPPSSGIPFSIT